MTLDEKKTLLTRVEVLEAQQAVMAGFISVLLQTSANSVPEPQRTALRSTYEALFERAIAQLLSSEAGFSDATVNAIEQLKINMMKIPSEK